MENELLNVYELFVRGRDLTLKRGDKFFFGTRGGEACLECPYEKGSYEYERLFSACVMLSTGVKTIEELVK